MLYCYFGANIIIIMKSHVVSNPMKKIRKYKARKDSALLRSVQRVGGTKSLRYSLYIDAGADQNAYALLQAAVNSANNSAINCDARIIIDLGRQQLGDAVITVLRENNAHIQDSLRNGSNPSIIKPAVSISALSFEALNNPLDAGLPVVVYTPSRGSSVCQVVPFSKRCYLKLGIPNVGVNDAIYSSWPETCLVGNVVHLKLTVYYTVIKTGNVA